VSASGAHFVVSLFRRLLRGVNPPRPKTIALEMPMLSDASAPDLGAALSDLRARSIGAPGLAEAQTGDGATVVEIPGGMVGLVHVPTPLPGREIEAAARVAWHWPAATSEIARHRSHLIASAMSTSLTALDLRVQLTRVVASILAATNAVGVYVGEAMLVRSAADYQADAAVATREAPPLMSWIGFNPVTGSGRTSAYTTGLTWFGLRELEVRRSSLVLHEVLAMLADLARYQLTTGRVLGNGDTFGSAADDRTRIRFRASEFNPDTEVAVLELP
jgi:hypothetical protein